MTKFKAGDRVRAKASGAERIVSGVHGDPNYDQYEFGDPELGFIDTSRGWHYLSEYELVTEAKESKMRDRKIYRLKKDSLEHDKGLIVMEKCTDGTQDFTEVVIASTPEHHGLKTIARHLIENKPSFWEEVTMQLVPIADKPKRGRPAKKK